MDLSQYAVASSVVIGFVNGIKLLAGKEWYPFSLFATSVIGGLFFGSIHWFGIPSAEAGLMIGLAASGAFEIAQRVGGK